jgi:HD-GYP domain-containing protein (c-di-GMP phosphodiesterase class II)
MERTPIDRWRGRPHLAAGLRAFVHLGPIGTAVGSAILAARTLHHAEGIVALLIRWTIVLVVFGLVLGVADRLARRVLPLAVLLRLSLPFPDAAPSRLGVARAAANLRELEERIRIARTTLLEDEPARAAEMTLSLVAAVEAHDRATRGHSERVRLYTDLIGEELKLYPADRDRLRWAALIHDVGKLEVPTSVLNKPGPLDPRELEVVRRHPQDGARLTRPLHDWLGEWAAAISEHHERWDGRGYPTGLSGSAISLGARIVAVADCYETMTAARPYHRPKTASQARQELVRCADSQFDPAVVNAFLSVSMRKLRQGNGPAAWIAQTPVLRGLERVASITRRIASFV